MNISGGIGGGFRDKDVLTMLEGGGGGGVENELYRAWSKGPAEYWEDDDLVSCLLGRGMASSGGTLPSPGMTGVGGFVDSPPWLSDLRNSEMLKPSSDLPLREPITSIGLPCR